MEVDEDAETMGEAHPVVSLEATAVLGENEAPCDMEQGRSQDFCKGGAYNFFSCACAYRGG